MSYSVTWIFLESVLDYLLLARPLTMWMIICVVEHPLDEFWESRLLNNKMLKRYG